MTHGRGESDGLIVSGKSSNKVADAAAEGMERRGPAKGNRLQQNALRTQGRNCVQSALERIRQAGRRDRKGQFTALLHHIYDIDVLREAYFNLKKDASAGIDGETWRHYGEALEENLQDLSVGLKRGAYRARPVRRVYIPKADGRQRPLGVPVLEDKVVQRAAVSVLNCIYEAEFLGFSYGFRPGRNQHNALDALWVGLMKKRVNWVLDADIRGFFDTISHEWLAKFIEHRIADRRVIRLIQKWLKAGVLEDGKRAQSEEGTPQGGSISPLLANIYLHYVFDLWAQQWRRKRARGDVIFVRYADDSIAGFEHKSDAERFLVEFKERLQKFGLELNPEKTRLIEFGRYAAERRNARGEGKPETFDYLGFTHICGETRKGKFTVKRKTIRKRLWAKLKEVKTDLKRRLHETVQEVGQWLKSVVVGHTRYYGVPGNYRALETFCFHTGRLWRRALCRRSQKSRLTWERMQRLIKQWLPPVRILHPYPSMRLGVIT